jgi:hypothetical protein
VYLRLTCKTVGATARMTRPIATEGTGCPEAAWAGLHEADAMSNAAMQLTTARRATFIARAPRMVRAIAAARSKGLLT